MDFHAATIGRMARQLRMYTIKPGELETFSREWGEHILPLRLQSGFRVLGPWVIDETNQFDLDPRARRQLRAGRSTQVATNRQSGRRCIPIPPGTSRRMSTG